MIAEWQLAHDLSKVNTELSYHSTFYSEIEALIAVKDFSLVFRKSSLLLSDLRIPLSAVLRLGEEETE